MQTAIDRLSVGKEKEINIMDFDGYRATNRFVCPECGEYVFPAVGKKNSFKHPKGKGLDCERRVDGQSNLTYYVRVGLSLYLKRNGTEISLKMAFPPLNKSIYDSIISKSITIKIMEDTKFSSLANVNIYELNSCNFQSEETSLLNITFVPYAERNYRICISEKAIQNILFKGWSDYADGFTTYGALFSYSESGGHKIRKNDTIEPHSQYYWVVPVGKYSVLNGLMTEFITDFYVGKNKFELYIITIEHKSDEEFKNLDAFFWNRLRLKLLYVKPQIIPIWPPVINTPQFNVPVHINPKNSSVFCAVKSDEQAPKIYKYVDSHYSEVQVHEENNQRWTILVSTSNIQAFSIDRKYLANAIVFSSYYPKFNGKEKFVNVLFNGEEIDANTVLSIQSNNNIEISSSQKIYIIFWYLHLFETVEIPANTYTNIKVKKGIFGIWILDGKNKALLHHIDFKKYRNKKYYLDCEDIRLLAKKCYLEPTVPISLKYKNQVKELLKCHLLLPTIADGKIQPTILRYIAAGGKTNNE